MIYLLLFAASFGTYVLSLGHPGALCCMLLSVGLYLMRMDMRFRQMGVR